MARTSVHLVLQPGNFSSLTRWRSSRVTARLSSLETLQVTGRSSSGSSCTTSGQTFPIVVGVPFMRLRNSAISLSTRRFCCYALPEPVDVEATVRDVNDEDDDFPLFMEEDDPTWPEDEDEGYGFPVSSLFEKWGDIKVKKEANGKGSAEGDEMDDEDEIDLELALKWEEEQKQWMVREITFLEWEPVALLHPTPLIVMGFHRYGPRGSDGWALLKELEAMLKIIVGSRKYPIRAVKFDVDIEMDLASALKIEEVPTLLFINAGKLLYRMTGVKSADELLLIGCHLFYHATKPSCMDDGILYRTVDSNTNQKSSDTSPQF